MVIVLRANDRCKRWHKSSFPFHRRWVNFEPFNKTFNIDYLSRRGNMRWNIMRIISFHVKVLNDQLRLLLGRDEGNYKTLPAKLEFVALPECYAFVSRSFFHYSWCALAGGISCWENKFPSFSPSRVKLEFLFPIIVRLASRIHTKSRIGKHQTSLDGRNCAFSSSSLPSFSDNFSSSLLLYLLDEVDELYKIRRQ